VLPPVVGAAAELAVVVGGETAVFVLDGVVDLAVFGGDAAVGVELAVAVADLDATSERAPEDAFTLPDLEDPFVGSVDDAFDVEVAE